MTTKLMKYNPAFLSDKQLKASFVARSSEFKKILKSLNPADPEQGSHVLVHGPRGAGKTTLVLRVAAELRENTEFSDKFLPVVFPEETYSVGSVDELWGLTVTKLLDDGACLNSDSPVGFLTKLAETSKKQLVLIIENFDMLLESQLSINDVVRLGDALKGEVPVRILATALRNFPDWEIESKRLAKLFKPIELKPLDIKQSKAIWQSITGEVPEDRRIRALNILTGGNPRLLALLSNFGASKSFQQLMDDLIQVIDDHTPYFKDQLDNLASTERRVFIALAKLWKPVTAREVSEAAGLDVSKTSSLLHRLTKRGKVEIVKKKGRVKWYQVTERLFNIYYLMRSQGASTSSVQALIEFMIGAYGHKNTLSIITDEAIRSDQDARERHFTAYRELIKTPCEIQRKMILKDTPEEFFKLDNLPDDLSDLNIPEFIHFGDNGLKVPNVNDLLKFAEGLLRTPGKSDMAVKVLRKAVMKEPKNIYALMLLCQAYMMEGKFTKAERMIIKAVDLHPEAAETWEMLGHVLVELPDRTNDAEDAFRKATQNTSDNPAPWYSLGMLYLENLERYADAEHAFRKAIEIDPDDLLGWEGLGIVLDQHLDRPDEAVGAYRKAIQLGAPGIAPYLYLTQILINKHDCTTKAFEAIEVLMARTAVVSNSIDLAIIAFEWWTAMGCGVKLLDLIEKSHSKRLLEPLEVGIKLYLGQEVTAPAEVLAVGQDIKRHIEDYAKDLEDKKE